MTTYDILGFEYAEGTEDAETYIVLVNDKDGPVFVTVAEAEAWIENQVHG